MRISKRNRKWFVQVKGGYRDKCRVAGETRCFLAYPEPVTQWLETRSTRYGNGTAEFTRFRAGDEFFTVELYEWIPARNYTWEESWELFVEDREPPVIREAYRWTGDKWEPIFRS